MANPSLQTQSETLLVICLAHTGYRRAGMAFIKGENPLLLADLSDEQILAIQTDKRLNVPELGLVPAPRSVDAASAAAPLNNPPLSFAQAIGALNKDNRDHFTAAGKPQCTALESLLDKPVTAAERDALWADFTAQPVSED
jgi:hypothetical protein